MWVLVNLLIAGSIGYLGNWGAWLSLGVVIIAIILGEIYLQLSQMQEQL
jgi:hypothetical protein